MVQVIIKAMDMDMVMDKLSLEEAMGILTIPTMEAMPTLSF
jgi:hypothetical protein